MGLLGGLLEKIFWCKLSLLPLPQPSSFLLFSVWTTEVMAGGPAAPLDHEVTLKVEATGIQTREVEVGWVYTILLTTVILLDCQLGFIYMSNYLYEFEVVSV